MAGWTKYRVIILGDVTPAQLAPAQQEMLRKYVSEEGGNLIVIAGQTAMPAAFADQPLGAMIPATASSQPASTTQPFSLAVTAEGSSSVPTQLDDDPLASERIWREMSLKLPIYNLSPSPNPSPPPMFSSPPPPRAAAARRKPFFPGNTSAWAASFISPPPSPINSATRMATSIIIASGASSSAGPLPAK
jgi:hypothetical protein